MLDKNGFDLWAYEYDEAVDSSKSAGGYPFEGYDEVHGIIIDRILRKPNATVLDVGLGTGRLSKVLYDRGYTIFGQDFSENMIKIAQSKMPIAELYQGDFSLGLAAPLKDKTFDFVVATYTLHHLTDEKKVAFINELLSRLNKGGEILIGDVSFPTKESMEKCKAVTGDAWDDLEHYIVAEEFKKFFPTLACAIVSPCACVLTIPSRN